MNRFEDIDGLATRTSSRMQLIKIAAWLGLLVMLASVIYALAYGDLSIEGPMLLNMPWGIVSLVDIYLGLLLFSFWVLWRESFSIPAMCWVAAIVILGNMVSCLYIIKACHEARGDFHRFWLGRRLSEFRGND